MLYTTLRQLEYVVAIANAGSLSDAARVLNVSQPALSVAVTQVERRQGQKIFIRRKGAAISLSSFGREFVTDAEALLSDAARLEDPQTQANRRLQRIVFGCYEDIAPGYLAPVLHHLRQEFEQVEFLTQVTGFEELASGMLEGQINFSITYDLGLDASFEKRLLKNVAPHVFFRPRDPLAKLNELTLSDLAHRPLILFDQGLSIRHMLGMFHIHNIRPRIAHRAASLEVMRSLAANGEGVGISYTRPPGDRSYDGKRVCARAISNSEALEPIVLAYSGLDPAMAPIPEIIESIVKMQNL